MAVRFILGRAGAGKTCWCIESVTRALQEENDRQSLVLLVPEQATYQAERAIAARAALAGYHRLRVLSFDRLVYFLLGTGSAAEISRIGQEMLIRKILLDNRDRLNLLAGSADTAGLAQGLTRAVIELFQCGHDPQQFRAFADKLQKDRPGSLCSLKFSDMAVVYEEYEKFLSAPQNALLNPDSLLEHACTVVAGSQFLKGARLWVDGFAGFTVQEKQLLARLLKVCSETQIALCIDPAKINIDTPVASELDPLSLFAATEKTYAELFEMAKKSGLKIEKPLLLQKALRFSNAPQLAHIESNIFSTTPCEKKSTNGNICIIRAADTRAEVTWVARQICSLVRNSGLRFRDIAVIVSDMNSYRHYIQALFDDYEIPFFIDRVQLLDEHPAVGLIISSLRAVTDDFPSNEVLAYVKSGFSPIEEYQADLLDNYCVAFGVRGSDWLDKKKWRFAGDNDRQFDDNAIDRLRIQAAEPLLELHNLLIKDTDAGLITAEKFARSIWQFLEKLRLREKLAGIDAPAAADARIHLQFYQKLTGALDEMVKVFGQRCAPAAQYVSIFCDVLNRLTLKLIPPRLDEVLVGSIERSRHPDLKAVFLLGASQGQFPENISFDSLLSDDDKNTARQYDLELTETLQQKLIARQYLVYIAFTRPSEKLFISAPVLDSQGRPLEISPFINQLKLLFSDLSETEAASICRNSDDCITASELAEFLCAQLAAPPDDERSASLAHALRESSDPGLKNLGEHVAAAVAYDNKASLEAGFDFYGGVLESSATRLADFAACPYRHFAKYVLKLQPRRLFKLEPVDVGRFEHLVLDDVFKHLKSCGLDFTSLPGEEIVSLCRQRMAAVVQADPFISGFARRTAYNEFIVSSACQAMEKLLPALAQASKAGLFRQTASEVDFGIADSSTGLLLETGAGKKVNVRGYIDRVDCATIAGVKVGLVFDYKRSGKNFSWCRFFHGLDMQLPIYILALERLGLAEYIAGGFFVPIEVAPQTASPEDSGEEKQEKFAYKSKGLFDARYADALDSQLTCGSSQYYNFGILKKDNTPYANYNRSAALKEDDYKTLKKFALSKITALSSQIFSGRIDVTPYHIGTTAACSALNCEFRSVCKFDWQLNDYNNLQSLDKQKAIEKMKDFDDPKKGQLD